MKQVLGFLSISLFSLFVSNCASSSVGVATSNRPIPNVTYETTKSVEKTFTWHAIDIVVFGISFNEPPIDKLYEQLLDGEQADAVVNIRYWNDKSIFGPWTRYRFSIKGDLVKFTNQSPTTSSKPKK